MKYYLNIIGSFIIQHKKTVIIVSVVLIFLILIFIRRRIAKKKERQRIENMQKNFQKLDEALENKRKKNYVD